MNQEEFKKVIQYAIEREEEAANFYHALQYTVKTEGAKTMLHELESMEWGHKRLLENLKNEGLDEYIPPKITNLKISDYLVEPESRPDMTFQEIIIVAMKRELAARDLYAVLANESENDKTKNLFLKLSDEESRHKLQLETIYDKEILYEN